RRRGSFILGVPQGGCPQTYAHCAPTYRANDDPTSTDRRCSKGRPFASAGAFFSISPEILKPIRRERRVANRRSNPPALRAPGRGSPTRSSTNERLGSWTAHGNGTAFSAVASSERPVLPSIDPIFGSGIPSLIRFRPDPQLPNTVTYLLH